MYEGHDWDNQGGAPNSAARSTIYTCIIKLTRKVLWLDVKCHPDYSDWDDLISFIRITDIFVGPMDKARTP